MFNSLKNRRLSSGNADFLTDPEVAIKKLLSLVVRTISGFHPLQAFIAIFVIEHADQPGPALRVQLNGGSETSGSALGAMPLQVR